MSSSSPVRTASNAKLTVLLAAIASQIRPRLEPEVGEAVCFTNGVTLGVKKTLACLEGIQRIVSHYRYESDYLLSFPTILCIFWLFEGSVRHAQSAWQFKNFTVPNFVSRPQFGTCLFTHVTLLPTLTQDVRQSTS